jgi:hypothetical protein
MARRYAALVARMTTGNRQEQTVRAVPSVRGGFWRGLGGRGRGRVVTGRLMHPFTKVTRPSRENWQVILRARRWADWAGFFHDRMLQHVGREMKNLQPSAIYNAPDFELLGAFHRCSSAGHSDGGA